MLTKYRLRLNPETACHPRPEWAYRLYAALLEDVPPEFGLAVHKNDITPISQFLSIESEGLYWTVSLLGEQTERHLSPLLEHKTQYFLKSSHAAFFVSEIEKLQFPDADALFERAASHGAPHRLRFCTATAFKSQGHYVILPTMRLIVQNLMKKWNGCFEDTCPIEDTDGQGMEALAAGLSCTGFQLQDTAFHLKGSTIPGFVGTMTIQNRLTGFHRELLNVLLHFADFSGIGIKTSLGMGGVLCEWN